MSDQPDGTEKFADREEVLRRRVLTKHDADMRKIEKIKERGEPFEAMVRSILRRFRPQHTEMPSPLETAAMVAFREEYPELEEHYASFVSVPNCNCVNKMIPALESDIDRFQKVVDKVYGEKVFRITTSPDVGSLVGTAKLIDPNPQAYIEMMRGHRHFINSAYTGLTVLPVEVVDEESPNGKKLMWAVLFW